MGVFMKKRIFYTRNGRLVTCLNGESLGEINGLEPQSKNQQNPDSQDNPVLTLSEVTFPKLPGIYQISCQKNSKIYIGQSRNLQQRISTHRSKLRRNFHDNPTLQSDFNLYGENFFNASILFVGLEWENQEKRIKKEKELILSSQPELLYCIYRETRKGSMNPFFGRFHKNQTKEAMSDSSKGIPNLALGTKIYISAFVSRKGNGKNFSGGNFSSISEASEKTVFSRRMIREKLDNPSYPEWRRILKDEE